MQTGQYVPTSEYLLLIGERWVHKLPVEDTGALGVRREQPNHKCDFQLEIKGKPERKREGGKKKKRKENREKDGELESRSLQRQMEIIGRQQHRQKE